MNLKNIVVTAFLLLFSTFCQALTGEITTKAFKELTLDIYVPTGNDNQRFPVMYVMDGQHYFYNAIAFQNSLRHNVNISPQFIVVGIDTEKLFAKRGARWQWFGQNADQMISELENKIVPYVERNFPANQTRMYFGWQAAAGFGLELFAKRPKFIEGYFLTSSPTFTPKRIASIEAVLNGKGAFNNYFYLSLGEQEDYAKAAFEELSLLLENNSNKGVRSKYSLSQSDTHQSTPLDAFTHGLRWYFSDYADFTFHSFQHFEEFGGIEAVKAYYRQRAARYGLSDEIGRQTRYSMFRHAVESDKWSAFLSFEQHFGEYRVESNAGLWHYRFFGNFFLKHQALERAKALFKQGVKHYPHSHVLKAKLAQIYTQSGEVKKAYNHYQQAAELVEDSSEDYQAYQSQMALLLEKDNTK